MGNFILRYSHRYKIPLAALFLATFIATAISFYLPQMASAFIDANSGYWVAWAAIPVMYLGTIAVKLLIDNLNVYLGQSVGWKTTNALRADLLSHCIDLDLQFHKTISAGALINEIDRDSENLSELFSSTIVNLLGNLILLIGILVYFFVENLLLGVVFFILAAISLSAFFLFKDISARLWEKSRDAEAEQFGFIEESYKSRFEILSVGGTDYANRAVKDRIDAYSRAGNKADFIGNLPSTIFYTLLNLGEAIGIGIGVYLFLQGKITMGTVYVISSYTTLLCIPLMVLQDEFINLQKITASYHRIKALFAAESQVPFGEKELTPQKENGLDIDIEHLSFGYREDCPVLKDISVRIPGGRTVAVIGKTGSGKTTLMNLMAKFYCPAEGAIYINGTDINQFSRRSFYRQVGVVSQSSSIISGTLRENLTLYSESKPDDALMDALHRCGLDRWADSLGAGLDTMINRNSLSAGQAQMLSLARMQLLDPAIYLLDEVTAYSDERSEEQFSQLLEKLSGTHDKTIVIIAHKPRILQYVDAVITMEDGRIKECGSLGQISAGGSVEKYFDV